jgi:hypothetical protein
VLDEHVVGQSGVDDLAPNRVGQGDVGADVEPQPGVGPLRAARAARIDPEEPGATMDRLEEVMEENRMRFARV